MPSDAAGGRAFGNFVPYSGAVTGVSMNRQGILNTLEEAVSVFFLAAGPALGAAIALAWVLGLVLGLFAVLTR